MHKTTAGSVLVLFPLVLSALPFAGCGREGGAEDLAVNSDGAEQAIVGGRVDTGDPAVVAIYAEVQRFGGSGGALCTGTVIAPTKILTAAHCVAPAETGPGATFYVLPVPDINHADRSSVLEVASTDFDPGFDSNHPENGHDIGVVTLAQPTDITFIEPGQDDFSFFCSAGPSLSFTHA